VFWRQRHEVSDEELSALVDGMLAPARSAAIERHAATCAVCTAALADLRTLKSLLNALPPAAPPRSFRLSAAQAESAAPARLAALSWRIPMAFAPAAALVLFVAVVGGDLLTTSGPAQDDATSGGASALSRTESAVAEPTVSGAGAALAPAPADAAAAGGAGDTAAPTVEAPSIAAAPPNDREVGSEDGDAAGGGAAGAPAGAEEQQSFTTESAEAAPATAEPADEESRTAWRVAEVLAAATLVASLAYLFWRRRTA
jgi:hypothetical protein